MNRHLRSLALAMLAAAILFAGGARASSLAAEEAGRIAAVRAAHPRALTSICPTTPIVLPVTIQGNMTTSACLFLGARDQAYSFEGISGQTLNIDLLSTAFDVFMVLNGPATLEGGQRQSFLSTTGTSRLTLTYTLPVSGDYTIEAMTFFNADDTTQPTTGPYTLTITTGPAPKCTADARTLCLNNKRFAVSAVWKTPDGTTGTGTAVALTSDTGYFWFFNSANVELVIKILDGRGANGKFWLFYGALSNVEYTITAVDNETGVTKTFTNPQGKLASVANINAFDP